MLRKVTVFSPSTNIERTFTCAQWAAMDGVPPGDWEVVQNTCADYLENLHSPFASFTPFFGAPGISVTGAGRWYMWSGIVTANKLTIPIAELVLPSNEASVFVTINRQRYTPSRPGFTRDFAVNTVDNSLDFVVGGGLPSLNGLRGEVSVWK